MESTQKMNKDQTVWEKQTKKSLNSQKKQLLYWRSLPYFKLSSYLQKYQFIWKAIYLLVSIASMVLFKRIYLFHTLPEFEGIPKGTFLDILLYAIPFGIVFTFMDIKIHTLFDKKCQQSFITLERYTDQKSKQKRSFTLVKWMYSLVYYFISSISAYLIIKDTTYFPTWLGGNGECFNFYTNAPHLNEGTTAMKIFYLCQLGKHLSRLTSHVFIRPEGNYYEYTLHHSLSSFLIFFSFLTNMWIIGTMVLLLHDFSDFFLISARTYKDYRHYSKRFLQFLYILGFSFWMICRILIFNSCCVYAALAGSYLYLPQFLDQHQTQILWILYFFMGLMLAALEVMHIFWTYFIISSFISVNVSEKVAKHSYD